MFGFGRSTKDPLSDVRTAERWLSTLPGDDTLAVHSDVVAQLERVSGQTTVRTPSRLQAVFHVDAQTGDQRRALIGQYIEHANRSSKIENQLWTALFGLTQGFLLTYQSFAREIADHPQSARWQELMPELLCRQIVHMALDARVRLFRYEQWIPAKWAELHGLMTLACSRQFERRPVALTDATVTTIEHEYLRALVLHVMNAGSLTARQVEFIWGELDDWCAPLRLTLEPSSANAFFVDLGGREGLRRRKPGPLESRVLFLDTRPLHAVMVQHVVTLEQKIKGEPLSSRTPRRSEQLTLFSKLAAQVDPEFRPFTRRGERVAAAAASTRSSASRRSRATSRKRRGSRCRLPTRSEKASTARWISRSSGGFAMSRRGATKSRGDESARTRRRAVRGRRRTYRRRDSSSSRRSRWPTR